MANSARDHMPAQKAMHKYHTEIENAVFAAEVWCKEKVTTCDGCEFENKQMWGCDLPALRKLIGEHKIGGVP